jgi:RHS repeat-associated protein
VPGHLLQVQDAASGTMNCQHDALASRQATDAYSNVASQVSTTCAHAHQLADMDLGTWSYTPNALGEVTAQTDAKMQTTTFSYDALGRPTGRAEAEGTSSWTWGSSGAARNIGRLQGVAGPGYSEGLLYDAVGRLATRTITADASYQYDYAYNESGQLHTLTYPVSTAGVRVKVKYLYTNGTLSQVRDYTGDVDGVNYWSLNLLNARGQAISEAYGNGLWLQSTYDALTGELSERRSGTGGSENNVQQLAYDWDTAGNLVSRQDLRQGLTETFSYDALDRLTGASGPGGSSLTLAFDAIGNLSSRSDVGSYTYHATRRHAVIAAGSNSYAYDANGNLTTRNGASVSWTSYNLPATLNAGGYSAQFSYAPDRARWRQVSSYATGSETTIYAGGLLEKLTTPVRTHWKHLIATPSGQVQRLRRSDGTSETLYLAADPLGSVEAVLDAAGAVRARLSFAAYGARRGSGWTGAPSPAEWQAIADTTRRGYGGHEMLDNVLLIHLNGRVYDPAIGRFLAADPYVDGIENTQGWNRYGYVKNNPLSYTDPSGYHELPTTQILPIDPITDLENIDVTASRLDQFFASMASIASEFAVVPAREPGRIEGGGGSPGGAPGRPRGEQPQSQQWGAEFGWQRGESTC